MPEQYSGIIMIVVMIAIFYFLLIRPENKRKKQAQQMRDSLKKGDMITSIGGIVGRVVHVTDSTIIIETSEDRVRMELTKWAVSSIGVQTSDQPEVKKEEKEEKTEKKEDTPAKVEEKASEGTESETK